MSSCILDVASLTEFCDENHRQFYTPLARGGCWKNELYSYDKIFTMVCIYSYTTYSILGFKI